MKENEQRRKLLTRREFGQMLWRAGQVGLALELGKLPFVNAQDSVTPTPTSAEVKVTPDIEELFNKDPDLLIDFTAMAEGPFVSENFNVDEGSIIKTEAQNYTKDAKNLRIEKYTDPATGETFNVLVLQAVKEKNGDKEYTSARINMKGLLDFTYGKIEVTAKFPKGAGVFPAIWLRSTDQTNSQNPTPEQATNKFKWALNGEIDIAEEQGADPGIINSTAHSYETLNAGGNPNGMKTEVADSEDAFHTYGAEWNEDKIVFTVDGEVTNEVIIQREADGSFDPAKAPWAHDFHLVINLAMGGNWAQDVAKRKGLDLPNGIDDSQEANWKFLIKDVKYFKLAAA